MCIAAINLYIYTHTTWQCSPDCVALRQGKKSAGGMSCMLTMKTMMTMRMAPPRPRRA